ARTWVSTLPVTVRISLGQSVDDGDCLSVFPNNWEIFTSNSNVTKEFTVKNGCKVGGNGISLRDLEIRIDYGSDNKVGEFQVESDLEGGSKITLGNSFQTVANSLGEGKEAKLTIEFKPDDVSSASQEIELVVQATNQTVDGPEELNDKIAAEISVNNLSECLQVNLPSALVISSCPINTGYGNYGGGMNSAYGGYFPGYDPYSSQGYGSSNYTGSDPSYLGSASNLGATYPYQQYNYPQYTTDYMNYDNKYTQGFACGRASFSITNSCASNIEISLEPNPAIIVAEKKITIEKGSEESIELQSGYMVGQYPLKVKAKIEGSDEAPQKIEELLVTVENELAKNYRDCISVSTTSLRFNDFISKPVTFRVINSCYNSGVRLVFSNSTINFQKKDLISNWAAIDEETESSPDGSVTQIITFDIEKNVSQYKNNAPPYPAEASGGGVPFVDGGNPFATIGNLRYFFTSGYYAVKGKTNMTVNFTNKYGSKSGVSFQMEIEDWWNALEHAARIPSFGDPNFPAKECVKPGALNITSQYAGCVPESEFTDGKFFFNTSIGGGLFKYATKDNQGNEKGGCGSMDQISNLKPGMVKKGEVEYWFRIDDAGHEIEVTILNTNNRSSTLNTTLYADVTRAVPGTTVRVGIPVNVCTKGTSGPDTPVGVEEVSCEGLEEAGFFEADSVFQKHGLDRLLFEWRYNKKDNRIEDGVLSNSCDAFKPIDDYEDTPVESGEDDDNKREIRSAKEAKFCDAVQFGIELSKKAERIQAVAAKLPNDCKMDGGTDCPKNAENLYRFAKMTVPIEDKRQGKTFYFFVKGNELLENKVVLEDQAEAIAELKDGILTGSLAEAGKSETAVDKRKFYLQYIQSVVKAMNELKDEKYYGDRAYEIVGKLRVSGLDAAKYNDMRESIGIEKKKVGTIENYYITFEEFRGFETEVMKGIERCHNNTTLNECKFDADDNLIEIKAEGYGQVTLEFIDALNKAIIEFRLGITNRDDLTIKERNFIMEEAANVKIGADDGLLKKLGEAEKTYGSFLTFHYDNIEFTALLVQDNYTTEFGDDFHEYFNGINNDVPKGLMDKLDFKDWKFSKMGGTDAKINLDSPGGYPIILNYNWKGDIKDGDFIIEFDNSDNYLTLKEIEGKLPEAGDDFYRYEKNPFLKLPIDGPVKFERGGSSDYGLALNKVTGDAQNQLYLMAKDSDYGASSVFALEKSLSSGIVERDFEFLPDLDKLNKGRILEINSGSFKFSPSELVTTTLEIKNSKDESKEIGQVYKVLYPVSNKSLSDRRDNAIVPLLHWKVVSDSTASNLPQGGLIGDKFYDETEATSLCGEKITLVGHGISAMASKKGSLSLKLWTFASPGTNFTIRSICSEDSSNWRDGNPKAFAFETEKGIMQSEHNLQNIMQRVSSDDVCIKVSADEFIMNWNPKNDS
ncbi:MAG: hypothetical protein ABID38_00680, partial [Candidatus Diapherotrites archaeon]